MQVDVFNLPVVAALGVAIGLPTKIAVDVIRGAAPNLPGGVIPLFGVILAFGIALLFQVATGATFTGPLWAQSALAALVGQAGAMAATATQHRADDKKEEAVKAAAFTRQDLK